MMYRRLAATAVLLVSVAPFSIAQSERHGRKYKAPPETSHLEVLVVKDFNGKVIENAGVIFHPTKDGEDEGNLEVKSGPDGKAFIDIIPTGSDVDIQVIANGFSTYAGKLKLEKASQALTVRMKRPQEQISAFEDRNGASTRKAGVQEPVVKQAPAPADIKPLSASEPVIKLPTLPANSGNQGDSTVPHTKPTTSQTPAKSNTTGTATPSTPTDGTTPSAH